MCDEWEVAIEWYVAISKEERVRFEKKMNEFEFAELALAEDERVRFGDLGILGKYYLF